MTTDNFCFYLQNRLIQTSQTGGQCYSDTSPFSIPWYHISIRSSIGRDKRASLLWQHVDYNPKMIKTLGFSSGSQVASPLPPEIKIEKVSNDESIEAMQV
jgi:hypothetical protein